jgi:uncharacterized protein YggE
MKIFVMALAGLLLPLSYSHIATAQVMGNAQHDSAGNSVVYHDNKPPRPAYRFQNSSSPANDSTVTVSVKGLINVLPDTYVATFNLVQSGENAETTNKLMRERLDRFKTNLRGIDTREADISTDMISFVPKYDIETENRIFSKTYSEVPAGFEMQKNVSVRYKKSAQLDELVTIAAQSEIYDLVKVDCFNSELGAFEDSLRMKCLSQVQSRVKSYEGLLLKLDTLKKTISEDFYVIMPETRYSGYQAFARTSLKPGKRGTLNEAVKVVSQYYKPLTYEDFDVLINPVVLEPMIQVTYEVNVTYQLKPVNKYFIITPGGESKRLILR